MARIKITKLPKALSGLEMKMSAGLYGKGTNGNPQFRKSSYLEAGKISQQPTKAGSFLTAVPREQANLEAEGGETAVVNIDGMPAHFKIKGKRHTHGGVPLNLPDNSFIFSDTAKMKITDPVILAQFGMVPKKGGYTPAEIAKKYDINKLRQVLADPNTDDLERKTAERMIANYNMKLAKLALIQESMKGFPQGVPQIAMPYVMATGMDPEQFNQMATQGEEEQPDADMGVSRYGGNIISQFNTKKYGGLPTAQAGLATAIAKEKELKRNKPKGSFFKDIYKAAESQAEQTRKAQMLEHYMNALEASREGNYERNWRDYIPFMDNSRDKEFESYLSKARDIGMKGSDAYMIDKILSIPGVAEVLSQPGNFNLYNQILANPTLVYENLLRQQAVNLNPKIKAKTETKVEPVEPVKTDTKVEEKPTTVLVNKPKVKVKSDYPYREKAIEVDEYGGNTGLNKYQNAGQTKSIVDYERSKSTGLARPVYSDGTRGEWENIESTVSPEDYAKLEALHKQAYEYDPTASGKDKNVAAEEFQKEYHKALEKTARNILVKEGLTQHGKKTGKKYWDVESNVDARYGPRTKQYWEALQKLKPKEEAPVAPTPPPAAPTPPATTPPAPGPVKTPTKPYEFKRYPVNMMPVSQKAPWFIQSAIDTGLGLKNLLTPYRARPEKFQADWVVPGGVYKSPDQAIYAIQSDANAARQAQAAINNPQALAAANAATQGIAAKNIIGQMADTENYNIGIANALASNRAGILNQAAQDRAATNRLFKRETDIEGQQYHNTKRADEAQFVNLLNAGITNAANAFNLNQLSENYKTDPWSGGKINFIADPNAIRANKNYDQGSIWKEYSDALDYTKDPNLAIELLKIKNKISPQSSGLYDPSYLATYPGSGS